MTDLVPGLISSHTLSPSQRDEMFTLLSKHFEGVSRAQFDRDLAEKNWVIAFLDSGCLVGFSTLLVDEVSFEGAWLTVIYSGDTIVAPEARGKSTLARTWIAAVNALKNAFPERPCFWLLLTSGFRTYRFLPVFWRSFFPRCDSPTPPSQQRLLEFLATERYGADYDSTAGIVRFAHPQTLRDPLDSIPVGREADANVLFFLKRNPGHLRGDELVCLCEISPQNLTSAGRRMVTAGKR